LQAVTDEMVCELSVRLLAIHSLILQHATGLEVGMETSWPLHTLTSRIHRLLEGKSVAAALVNWHKGEHEKILEVDGVIDWGDTPPNVDIADDHSDWKRPAVAEGFGGQADVIRIDASVIDGLMSTVGEMVQQRSRLQMFAEQLRREFPGHPTMEELYRTAETLERSMVTVQTGIMGTRLQPLSRLFDNYPRVLRDVARIADREVIVEIEGGSTQVDKSIIDGLGEPLMAILRYCASRSIEKPADRESKNKPKEGTIKLSARDQGSQVVITVQDDGAGFDRKECCGWLVDCGMMTFEQAEKLGDDELAAMMFEGDVATSPLRRVASMLQVSVGGSFMVHSSPTAGARIDLVVPMKSAILSAVLVAAGDSAYTVPLQAIIEITRIERTMIKTIAGAATMRLRDDVFPLLDARKLFGDKAVGEPAFALVITTGQTRAALGVDRVISKQDMIIKQIDDAGLRRGPFSGTTLTREGKVSLVLDVQRMLAAALDHR